MSTPSAGARNWLGRLLGLALTSFTSRVVGQARPTAQRSRCEPTGYAVTVRDDGVRVRRFSAKPVEEWEVLATWNAKLEGTKKVSLTLQASTLTVQVNGQSWSTKVPADDKPGYLGFAATGAGYAGLSELQIRRN